MALFIKLRRLLCTHTYHWRWNDHGWWLECVECGQETEGWQIR